MWVRNNKGNVFVGNLPPDFSDERLAEAFDPFGIVLSALVARDPTTGARLRYGFVDIATEKAATKAISALDGTQIDGCKLNVKPRDKQPKKTAGAAAPRRPAFRTPRSDNAPARDFAARQGIDAPPRRPFSLPAEDHAAPLSQSEVAQRRLAQTERAVAEMPEIEPPPRRDFEIVRRPVRRTAAPTFQVERWPLPRRAP